MTANLRSAAGSCRPLFSLPQYSSKAEAYLGKRRMLCDFEQLAGLPENAAAFDGLNRRFSNDRMPVRAIRSVGLGLVDRLPGLKSMLVREAAGLAGDVPRMLRGEMA